MAVHVLGISAFYHDSAAAIVRDGEIIAAAQEERFTRKKHDPRFPENAINYCLGEAYLDPSELSAVVFYDNPLLTTDRVIKNFASVAPKGPETFTKAMTSMLGQKIWIKKYVTDALGVDPKLLISEHHFSHAASAFYPSPFQKSAILTMDGVGEWATTALGIGEGKDIRLLKEINYPHSLGLLYSAFTYFCGFKVNSGEYKLMGLAPYGSPRYVNKIKDHLIDIKKDGSFRLNMKYFAYLDTNFMINKEFENLFGGPPRKPEARITSREMDLAASIQAVTEETVMALARHATESAGTRNLAMAGGVALNCVTNGKLLSEGIVDNLWIQPAAGDAGGALGAALMAVHQYFDVPRFVNKNGRDTQKGSYLGPSFSSNEVQAFLNSKAIPFERVPDDNERAKQVARALADGKVVGFMSGRMEFGPRALGARSILGDPRSKETQSVMNLKIKFRESFRPFAPSVMLEDVNKYFDTNKESPYMLLVAPVRKERRLPFSREYLLTHEEDLLAVVNQPRSDLPAVTHVDYSARVQTVHQEDKPDYYEVLKEFKKLTGDGVVVNTSFNVRGEPIVCTPQDAYRCFMRSGMDMLVMEDCVLRRSGQPEFHDDKNWRRTHELD